MSRPGGGGGGGGNPGPGSNIVQASSNSGSVPN